MFVEEVSPLTTDTSTAYPATLKFENAQWNGRYVRLQHAVNKVAPSPALNAVNKADLNAKVIPCKFLWGYFDPDNKKALKFETDVLLYAIHYQTPAEEKRKKEMMESLAFGSMVAGRIGVLIFKRDFISATLTGGMYVCILKDKITVSMESFMKMLKERNQDYANVHFYTVWEEYEKNRQDLITRGYILDTYDPASPTYI